MPNTLDKLREERKKSMVQKAKFIRFLAKHSDVMDALDAMGGKVSASQFTWYLTAVRGAISVSFEEGIAYDKVRPKLHQFIKRFGGKLERNAGYGEHVYWYWRPNDKHPGIPGFEIKFVTGLPSNCKVTYEEQYVPGRVERIAKVVCT